MACEYCVAMDEIIEQLVRDVAGGRPVEEVVDAFINTAETSLHLRILDELGDVDLSEPVPDLALGWNHVRGQLAYNALYAAVSRRAKDVA